MFNRISYYQKMDDIELANFDDANDDIIDEEDTTEETQFVNDSWFPEVPLTTPETDGLLHSPAALRTELDKTRIVDDFYKTILYEYGLSPETPNYDIFEVRESMVYLRNSKGPRVALTRQDGRGYVSLRTVQSKVGLRGITVGLRLTDYKTNMVRRKTKVVVAADKVNETARTALASITEEQTFTENQTDVQTLLDSMESLIQEEEAAQIGASPLPLPMRELMGLDKTLRTLRGTQAVQESKLVEIDQKIADIEFNQESGTELEFNDVEIELDNLKATREAIVDSISTLRQEQRSQLRQIKDLAMELAYSDLNLREKLVKLFREQGVTVVSIITALSFIIVSIALAIGLASGGSAAASIPKKPDAPADGPVKSIGRMLKRFGVWLGTALPGIIGGALSLIVNLLAEVLMWVGSNVWLMVLTAGGVVLSYVATKRHIN